MTDDQARNVQQYEYDSFGNQHDMKNRIKQPYGYTGREHDRETGLRYYRARYYDGGVGVFLSKDPISFMSGDTNLYRYVGGNPIKYIDPSGLYLGNLNYDASERAANYSKAVTMQTFINHVGTRDLWTIQHEDEVDGFQSNVKAQGPAIDYRFVINPNNNNEVLDMRHFLVVGEMGEMAGLLIEVIQLLSGQKSGFDSQDFLSNEMGAEFFENYDYNRPLGEQLEEYFYGRKNKCN